MSNVTFCLTSCNRFDLLKQTLDSFLKFNTYEIKTFLFIDDSENEKCHENIKANFPFVQVISNMFSQGQIKCIDQIYQKVDTEYIFHCEDDWLFIKKGFIEKSMTILNSYPDIFQVWIRNPTDHCHPLMSQEINVQNTKFRELLPMWKGVYSGFTFNPSLRRLKDYKLLQAPFSSIGGETKIGHVYAQKGFKFVSLLEGFCYHIGYDRHVDRPLNDLSHDWDLFPNGVP